MDTKYIGLSGIVAGSALGVLWAFQEVQNGYHVVSNAELYLTGGFFGGLAGLPISGALMTYLNSREETMKPATPQYQEEVYEWSSNSSRTNNVVDITDFLDK